MFALTSSTSKVASTSNFRVFKPDDTYPENDEFLTWDQDLYLGEVSLNTEVTFSLLLGPTAAVLGTCTLYVRDMVRTQTCTQNLHLK